MGVWSLMQPHSAEEQTEAERWEKVSLRLKH